MSFRQPIRIKHGQFASMQSKALTSFRFFAALFVVIFHYGRETSLIALAPELLTAGRQMVTFFFVLSGFVMITVYSDVGRFSVKSYWTNRFARIAPMYFLALFMAVYIYYGASEKDSSFALLLNVLFLQSWLPPYPTSFNTPAWSLSVEAFFYLSFPALIAWLDKYRPSPGKALVIGIAVWLFTQLILIELMNSPLYQGQESIGHDLVQYFPLSHFCSFFLGVCGGYWALAIQKKHKISPAAAYMIVCCAFLIVFAALEFRPADDKIHNMLLPFGSSLLAPVFLTFILAITLCNTIITRIFSITPLLILGEASYGIYILQNPIYYIFSRRIQPLLHVTVETDFVCYLFILISISVSAFFFFEMPAKKSIRRLIGGFFEPTSKVAI